MIDATTCLQLSGDEAIGPTSEFKQDAEAVHIAWKSQEARQGMNYKVVWVAEDVGQAAPPNTTITEKSGVLEDQKIGQKADWWSGNFSLSRPTNGWPAGRYRADIYFDGKKVKSLPFSVRS